MKTTPSITGILPAFTPQTATVYFSGSKILPSFSLKLPYFHMYGLFDRLFWLSSARSFMDITVRVVIPSGESFLWDQSAALHCFMRRTPDYDRLISVLTINASEVQ